MANETTTQSAIRQHFTTRQGWRLFRNNVGQLLDARGVPLRYGLANESPQMNQALKSGDLIGWAPLLITPDMVGGVVAQFVSIEAKRTGWSFPQPTNKREFAHCDAQRRWARMIRDEGGIAGFMIDPSRGFEPD